MEHLGISMEYPEFPSRVFFQNYTPLWYPEFASTRAAHNTNFELIPSLSITHGTHPHVASTRVNHNTNVVSIPSGINHSTPVKPQCVYNHTNIELKPCLGINHGALMLSQCMENVMLTLKFCCPWASIMVPSCRLSACKTRCKR